MSASTGSLSSNILFIRLELEQVQPGNRVIRTVYRSVQNIDHHLMVLMVPVRETISKLPLKVLA